MLKTTLKISITINLIIILLGCGYFLTQQFLYKRHFRQGTTVSFNFSYPSDYHVASGIINNSENENYVERFYMNNAPILFFPHSTPYITGTTVISSEDGFNAKEKEIALYQDAQELPWTNPNTRGSCYIYTNGKEGEGMFGKTENNISCVLLLKNESEDRLFTFEANNTWGFADKIDPSRIIVKKLFESISKQDF